MGNVKNRTNLIRAIALASTLSISACASNLELSKIESLRVKFDKDGSSEFTLDEILRYYFTNGAYERLREVPLLEPGPLHFFSSGYASDGGITDSFWTLFSGGIGFGRHVAIERDILEREGDYLIVHEYLHQATSLGLIKNEEFKKAYERYKAEGKGWFYRVERRLSQHNIFSRLFGDMSDERLAIFGEYLATDSLSAPLYMHKVFENTLSISQDQIRNQEAVSKNETH